MNSTIFHDPAHSINCYALPYGLIGTISHVLTVYTIIALGLHRKPLKPWEELDPQSHNTTFLLSIVSIIITLTTTILAMVRCRKEWEYICLVVWKLSLSLALAGITGHTSTWVWSEWAKANPKIETEEEIMLPRAGPHGDLFYTSTGRFQTVVTQNRMWVEVEGSPFPKYVWWYGLYTLGCMTGLVGMGRLVHESWGKDGMRRICYGFVGGIICLMLILIISGIIERIRAGGRIVGWLFGTRRCGKTYEKSYRYGMDDRHSRLIFVYKSTKQSPQNPYPYIVAHLTSQQKQEELEKCRDMANRNIMRNTSLIFLVVVSIIAIFCSDWVLATIAGKTSGAPDGNNKVLYWLYFAAKRLPLFSA